ncbi:hypothetical protein D3C80_742240 [compost metagenome]
MTNAANQVIVSHAFFCVRISSQVSTPVSSNNPKPIKAVVVGSTAQAEPKIMAGIPAHSINKIPNTPSIMISFLLTGPISFNLVLAN